MLAMTLVSHSVRRFMLAKSQQKLWQLSLHAEGMPSLESTDISYLQLANLFFGASQCSLCGRVKVGENRIDPGLRIRACASCAGAKK